MHALAVRATPCSPWGKGSKKEVRKLSTLGISNNPEPHTLYS